MTVSIRQKLGALYWDVPRYLFCFAQQIMFGTPAWIKIRDRDQHLIHGQDTVGISHSGKWSSNLHLPSVFPWFGRTLYKFATKSYPIDLTSKPLPTVEEPEVSFIIGHRGLERLPLLLKTLESIAAQTDCLCECIVIEQDTTQRIKDQLPAWVRYVHIIPQSEAMPYSRSWAFNIGACQAKSRCLIFHDNDLLVPNCYASEMVARLRRGFEFINLKRFVFYLDEGTTRSVLNHQDATPHICFESITQNLQGGGSIGASKDSFFDIGGFDERFVGWGGEDSEFWERAQTKPCWQKAYLPLLHLWHLPQTEKQNFDQSKGRQLYEKLTSTPELDRITALKQANAHYESQ